ncbi:MAG: glycosyltransferase [Saccharofermentans sp.]|nr:glycosyltransferase [Saccharofermentans sp.]
MIAKRMKMIAGRMIRKAHPEKMKSLLKTAESMIPNVAPAMVDVCFINGCDYSVPHPIRYRVTHQREQLEANGVSTSEIFYTEVREDDARCANMFIVFRCPHLDNVEKCIRKAQELGKPVFFDVDDLVIDTVYTDQLPYVQGLDEAGKNLYDDGVNRMGRTLKLCDGAITTTKALADELKKFVPEVIVNRNTASDEMWKHSVEALELKERNFHENVKISSKPKVIVPRREEGEIRIGYFSGSITHNSDFEMIMNPMISVMKNNPGVILYIAGPLDVPEPLKEYKDRIRAVPFMDWRDLPKLISLVDINIAPLEDTIFNRAKSENKWVEASLVKTVTVASNVGAFAEMIEDGKTGFLCKEDEWEACLDRLVKDGEERAAIANTAFNNVKENCTTISSGMAIADFVRKKTKHTAVFVFPSTEISGGLMVAQKHAAVLRRAGYQVTILAQSPTKLWLEYDGVLFPVIKWHQEEVRAYFEKAVATMWVTVEFLENYGRIGDKYYLVQNYETDFYEPGIFLRPQANRTYSLADDITYVTISKWCQGWLKDKYRKESRYIPNGMVTDLFPKRKRDFTGKVKVLIEGDSEVAYKGVDESFKIANELDRNRFEVWYLSYNGKAKSWYKVDKFLHRVPYEEVGKIYEQCDILLKSSTLESFSYPPLEMMATGGFSVLLRNGGNVEYLEDGVNCLFYEPGDIKSAVSLINKLVDDAALRATLESNFGKTVSVRDWSAIEPEILKAYNG